MMDTEKRLTELLTRWRGGLGSGPGIIGVMFGAAHERFQCTLRFANGAGMRLDGDTLDEAITAAHGWALGAMLK